MVTAVTTCRTCETPLPADSNPQRQYCTKRCRTKAAKANRKVREAELDGIHAADALGEGEWVLDPVRRIQVWKPDPAAEVLEAPKAGRPELPRVCGTERGYHQHRHDARKGRGEWPLPADDPCGCRAAHAAHQLFRSWERRQEQAERRLEVA